MMPVVECSACGKPVRYQTIQGTDEAVNRVGFVVMQIDPCGCQANQLREVKPLG